jgi:hypothetical protein
MLRQPLSSSTAKISMAVLSQSTRLVLVKTALQAVVVGALMGLAVTSAAVVVAAAVVVMTVAVVAVAVVAADAATSVVVNLGFSFKTGTN